MAAEIINTLDGQVDEFIMGVGTGGCFSGNAEVLKNQIPGVLIHCESLLRLKSDCPADMHLCFPDWQGAFGHWQTLFKSHITQADHGTRKARRLWTDYQ